ncbi:MAG: hydrogenase maturation nickel metallochaperone HypA [Dethiobacter sp.]|nr:hydrogenase maturation nickel metallochaperone HypA [Dethiobacter sp.]MBS3900899.1 hydrogenase maturation nickel metallochaperone HypA [Dethiobacter sp.]MBS3989487.1 hydrogenase maturation nickel metallochaperone HypA [Dethiobacter sp.]
MHELSLVSALVEEVSRDAQERGVSRITSVSLAVGKRAHALPHALLFCFDLIKRDTILAAAQLIIEVIPPLFHCESCGLSETHDALWLDCTCCGLPAVPTGGTELEIRGYEGDCPRGGKEN